MSDDQSKPSEFPPGFWPKWGQGSLLASTCSGAPTWYTAEEMHHYLRCHKYSDEIADELSAKYAENLQRAFNKGYQIGSRQAARQNDRDQARRSEK